MMLSKRFVTNASKGSNYLCIFLLGLLILFMNCKFKFLHNLLLTPFLLVLIYLSFVYLRAKDIQFSYFSIFFSGVTAFIIPNLYKYLSLIYLSTRLKNLAIIDPLTGFYSARFFLLQLDEKLKSKEGFVFVALRLGNYKRLTLRLNFEQIKLLTRLFSEHLRTQVKTHFKAAVMSRISNDTFGMVIAGAGKEEIVTFLRTFVEKTKALDLPLGEKIIRVSQQICLIHRDKQMTVKSDGVIFQMENLFTRTEENQILAEALEDGAGEEKNTKHKDILDFIAFDWEERDKDLEQSLREILEANKRLDRLNRGALTALARTIDAKSKWTAGHSERVTKMAIKIGRALGLTREELDNLYRVGLLHDIGKIGTPAELIDKTERLTDEESQKLREHPNLGGRILEPIEAYAEVIPMVKQHHEWFNGKGYPDGIAGEEINLGARILAVADVYDALLSERPFRAPMELDQVVKIIEEDSGSHFDPAVVEALEKVMEQDGKRNEKADRPPPSPKGISTHSTIGANSRSRTAAA